MTDIEHGHFTPLVFGTNGGMGKECQVFINSLAEKLAVKQNEDYPIVITWLRTRLSFEILKSVHMCVRGSRVPFTKKDESEMVNDYRLNVVAADILAR